MVCEYIHTGKHGFDVLLPATMEFPADSPFIRLGNHDMGFAQYHREPHDQPMRLTNQFSDKPTLRLPAFNYGEV